MPPSVIAGLVGVYNADGTLAGEIGYWIGARLGLSHCALCDITHGLVAERADWVACRATLPVPFRAYHRNDQPEEIRRLTAGSAPLIVADLGTDRFQVLLGPNELDACCGNPDALVGQIILAAKRARLDWST